jgi:hypothetical protein
MEGRALAEETMEVPQDEEQAEIQMKMLQRR